MQRSPIIIPLADLHARAISRPEGYVADVVSRGHLVGSAVQIEPSAYAALVAKYQIPKPAPEWPLWALLVGVWFRQPEDVGIGDTIERELGGAGTEAFKRHHEAMFGVWAKPCACAGQVANWNALYPYEEKQD
jgi:hypothetical protein